MESPLRVQQIYTDGSCVENGRFGGAAFVTFVRSNNQWEGKQTPLRNIRDSNEAEAQAISLALSWAIANIEIADEFTIRCDCTGVIDRIGQVRQPMQFIEEGLEDLIIDKIKVLEKQGKIVSFRWIKAHQGYGIVEAEGNQWADQLASDAMIVAKDYGWGLGEYERDVVV